MRSVRPGPVEGVLTAPPSKSVFQRAVAAATLADGTTTLAAHGLCDDALSALDIATTLGATVERRDEAVRITGNGQPTGAELDCGEAGTSLRIFTAVAALHDQLLTLVARGTLATRPMEMVVAPLQSLGVQCSTHGGLPPVLVRGPMTGGLAAVDGSTTSQFLTGLLIALPRCAEDSLIEVAELRSKPYVRLTVSLLERFGVDIEHDDGLERFHIRGNQGLLPADLAVEGDWSGASFPLVAGAIAGDVTVQGLDPASPQADRRVIEVIEAAGADLQVSDEEVRVVHRPLKAFRFDATHCPDLFPPLAVLATACRGTSVLLGVHRLRHKESDRAAAIHEQLGRIGARVRIQGDAMEIEGGALTGGEAEACGDHRIAMALAVAGLTARAPVAIHGWQCVSKSYPEFFEDLVALGGSVQSGD